MIEFFIIFIPIKTDLIN